MELNDIGQIVQRQHTPREFAQMIVDQFNIMIEQCVHQPLVFALSLHTYITGQPFHLAALQSALQHILQHPKRDRVWLTRADDISDYCYALPPGLIPGG